MRSKYIITLLALVLGGFIGAFIHRSFVPSPTVHQLRLEEILSVKELHLVKHIYKDMFFLHRKNDASKAIRAIAQVPVTITSYINLKEIQLIKEKDSVKKIILPRARLNEPNYQISNMVIRETRTFQLHVGADLYPQVGRYLKDVIAQRLDTIRSMAVANQILVQAEAEGKEYIETLLKALGRTDIVVTFGDTHKDEEVAALAVNQPAKTLTPSQVKADTTHYVIDDVRIGWIPVE